MLEKILHCVRCSKSLTNDLYSRRKKKHIWHETKLVVGKHCLRSQTFLSSWKITFAMLWISFSSGILFRSVGQKFNLQPFPRVSFFLSVLLIAWGILLEMALCDTSLILSFFTSVEFGTRIHHRKRILDGFVLLFWGMGQIVGIGEIPV